MGNSDSKAARGGLDSTVATNPGLAEKGAPISDFEVGGGRGDSKNPENRDASNGRKKKKKKQLRDIDDTVSSSHITEDQIQVNLAMADLMAYLQVVANNSNHLPLTRRDDPELDRTVSSLSSEDYARKSAAFIPADVRVIGGTFTRYGRVWDLPTSEEYDACDGAHEPGRSYGGACTNSFLKVVYDAANEMTGVAQSEAASQALFDDDDEEEESTWAGKSYKSGFSLEYASPNLITITWADLLRRMKAEVKEIEYAQAPKITTSRKIDLNKAFSLVPDDFDRTKGKKRSLLIGCNYSDIEGAELKASHDDIRSMKDYIVNVHGFPDAKGSMTILLDDGDHKRPTFMNIIEAFKVLSEESMPGDAVFVQFSGHGGRVLDAAVESEAESYDEVIVPVDYKESGLIRDTLIFKTLLAPMRYGVTVTIMIDTCDTGMVMELPYSWSTKSEKRGTLAKLNMNEDFSFVRFLKVVKTLYESSTFTQLGRTVGSALNPMTGDGTHEDEKKSKDGEDLMQVDTDLANNGGRSIFDTIDSACNGTSQKEKVQSPKSAASDGSSVDRKGAPKQSILEQVMNCTFMSHHDDDAFEDDDTFRTRTDDEPSFDDAFSERGMSYETFSDEESTGRPSRSRSRRAKRR